MKTMKRLVLAGMLLLAGCIELADAAPPAALSNSGNYDRPGAPVTGHAVAVPTGPVTKGYYLNDTGSYTDERDLQLLGWGTWLRVTCAADVCVCLTMDDDTVISAGTSCGDMTDPNSTVGDATSSTGRAAACTQVGTAGADILVLKQVFPDIERGLKSTSKAGTREKVCSTASTGTPGFPCDADNDCLTSAGAAGTCVHEARQTNTIQGAFLQLIGSSTTTCFIGERL